MSSNISHSILPDALVHVTHQDAVHFFAGSDVQLTQTAHLARAAKRRRIEDHARAYIAGDSLFIATAALRGPFGRPWVNPWIPERRRSAVQQLAARRIPNTSVKASRVQTNQSATQTQQAERQRRGPEQSDSTLARRPGLDKTAALPTTKSQRSSAQSRVRAAKLQDPFNSDKRNGNGSSSRLNSDNVTFDPASISPFTHRWLKRQSSTSDHAKNARDAIWEDSRIKPQATPTNQTLKRARREFGPGPQPRLEPIVQGDGEVEDEIGDEDQDADEDEEQPVSLNKSSQKKRLSAGKPMQITSPALNGSQGLQFRKGGRGWKEAIASARFQELEAADQISPNRRSFGSATRGLSSAAKTHPSVDPIEPRAAQSATKVDASRPDSAIVEDPVSANSDSESSSESDVEDDSQSEAGSTASEAVSATSGSASTDASAPEPLPPTATLQPNATVSTVPSGTASNAPPDHQPEDYGQSGPTEEPPRSSRQSTDSESDDAIYDDAKSGEIESNDDSCDEDDSDQNSTIMVYNSAKRQDMSTQAAYNQAQEALEDIFVTPAASPERIDETIMAIEPTTVPEAQPAEGQISNLLKSADNPNQAPSQGTKRKVSCMLDTPDLERIAEEVTFSTIKRRRVTTTTTSSNPSTTHHSTTHPTKSLLKRSFPTPPTNTTSPCQILSPLPITTSTDHIASTSTSKRKSTDNDDDDSPTENHIFSTLPDHQPSQNSAIGIGISGGTNNETMNMDHNHNLDLDLDLDSCLKDAAGLLGTADLEVDVRGARRSLGTSGAAAAAGRGGSAGSKIASQG